jgi:hypothetical protein
MMIIDYEELEKGKDYFSYSTWKEYFGNFGVIL